MAASSSASLFLQQARAVARAPTADARAILQQLWDASGASSTKAADMAEAAKLLNVGFVGADPFVILRFLRMLLRFDPELGARVLWSSDDLVYYILEEQGRDAALLQEAADVLFEAFPDRSDALVGPVAPRVLEFLVQRCAACGGSAWEPPPSGEVVVPLDALARIARASRAKRTELPDAAVDGALRLAVAALEGTPAPAVVVALAHLALSGPAARDRIAASGPLLGWLRALASGELRGGEACLCAVGELLHALAVNYPFELDRMFHDLVDVLVRFVEAAAIDASATPGAADALSRLLGALALAFESYPPDLEVSAVDTWATWLTRALTAVTAAPSSSWLGGKVAKLLAPATLVDGEGQVQPVTAVHLRQTMQWRAGAGAAHQLSQSGALASLLVWLARADAAPEADLRLWAIDALCLSHTALSAELRQGAAGHAASLVLLLWKRAPGGGLDDVATRLREPLREPLAAAIARALAATGDGRGRVLVHHALKSALLADGRGLDAVVPPVPYAGDPVPLNGAVQPLFLPTIFSADPKLLGCDVWLAAGGELHCQTAVAAAMRAGFAALLGGQPPLPRRYCPDRRCLIVDATAYPLGVVKATLEHAATGDLPQMSALDPEWEALFRLAEALKLDGLSTAAQQSLIVMAALEDGGADRAVEVARRWEPSAGESACAHAARRELLRRSIAVAGTLGLQRAEGAWAVLEPATWLHGEDAAPMLNALRDGLVEALNLVEVHL